MMYRLRKIFAFSFSSLHKHVYILLTLFGISLKILIENEKDVRYTLINNEMIFQ